jgi:hypothetical protein
MNANNELAYFKALSQHLPKKSEENTSSQSQDQELNPDPREYTSQVITTNMWFTTKNCWQVAVCV